MMLSALAKKTTIENALKWIFCGFIIFFIAILLFMQVPGSLTGISPQTTAEYCAKYQLLASPDC